MLTIALVSSKGGSSKTVTATNLAVAAAADGNETLLVDLDPQESAVAWGVLRGGRPPAVLAGLAVKLRDMLEAARTHGADVVLIDTQGHAAQSAAIAAGLADLVLVPARSAAVDILAIRQTVSLLKNASAMDRSVAVLVVPSGKSREGSEAEAALTEIGFDVLEERITERAAYRQAWQSGAGVIETEPGGAAAREMRELWAALKKHARALNKRREKQRVRT